MKCMTFFLFLLIVFLGQNASAIQVSGLYQATVPVTDETVTVRGSAIGEALKQVLVKLTGDKTITVSSEITTLIQQAERYVQQFRYRQISNVEEPTEQTTELWVQFDETALNKGLETQGLAIWGKERPSVLVWLAYEEGHSRNIVSFEDNPEYITILDDGAKVRGVPLLFPLLDLEDSARISVSDVWGDFKEPIVIASSRYQADVMLTGRLIQVSSTLWEARWSVYIGEQTETWTSQGEIPEFVLEDGVNGLADRIAAKYANMGPAITEMLELLVTDVDNVDEYARALSYLESVQSITSVQVKRVYNNNVMFELVSRGGISGIEQSIALGKTLEAISGTEQYTYRLLPR